MRALHIVAVIFCLFIFPLAGHAQTVGAECGGFYAGPPGEKQAFRFTSSCIPWDDSRRRLKYEICSASKRAIAFRWEELSWVSGRTALTFSECLSYTRFAVETGVLNTTTIRTNVRTEQTPAFVAKPISSGENWRADFIERNPSTVEPNGSRPFVLRVIIRDKTADGPAQLRAVLNGSEVDFVLILPAEYNDEDQLKDDILSINQNDPRQSLTLVENLKQFQADADDPELAEYLKEQNLLNRQAARSRQQEYGSEITIRFDAAFSEFADGISICLSDQERLISCLGG